LRFVVAATGVKIVGGTVYVAINDAGACRVSVFKDGCVEDVISLRGRPCALVWGSREGLLVSCGEVLYLVSGNEARPVLRARPGNWFWHACGGDGRVFVQEHGEPPTGIYVTEDLETFARVVTNWDIDPRSRHFHFVAFDRARGLLVATLGDGNLVRAAVSQDYGHMWRPLYKGPWQFVPVLIDGDKIVFGFDSGIAKGGVGVYDVERNKWSFEFLKSLSHRRAQFASLKKFGDYYIGSLGYPTAIVVSRDLRHWHLLYLNSSTLEYNHFVDVEPWREKVVAVTGKEILVFELGDVERAFEEKPFLTLYRAYLDRLKGLAFKIKRIKWILEP
jgi:hypothetical protein